MLKLLDSVEPLIINHPSLAVADLYMTIVGAYP